MSEKKHYNFKYIEDRVRFEHDIENKLISEFVKKLETLKNLHYPGSLTNRKIDKLILEYEEKLQ